MNDQVADNEVVEELADEAVAGQAVLNDADPLVADVDPNGEAPSERQAESARFNDLDEEAAARVEPSLDVILNIPVTLSMEVGRTQMTIRELMELKRGSVVKFDRLAGEPMDVLVNGTLVAHGEVVVVNDKFGIRLIDVISPAERVRKLR